MDKEERLRKALEFLQDRLAEGWVVDVISTSVFTSDNNKPTFVLEVVLEKQ